MKALSTITNICVDCGPSFEALLLNVLKMNIRGRKVEGDGHNANKGDCLLFTCLSSRRISEEEGCLNCKCLLKRKQR